MSNDAPSNSTRMDGMTSSQEPSQPPREGLLHSLGSVLSRTLPWWSKSQTGGPVTGHDASTVQGSITASSPSHLPSRHARALPRPMLSSTHAETNGPTRTVMHSMPSSLRPTAPTSSLLSSRSKWGSLNLAPAPSLSLASEMPATLQKSTSAAQPSVLGKRDEPMHEHDMEMDNDSHYVPSSRKRRMVWDSEMGFVDAEDLAARRPPPPPPQNEAERILRALETMRTPLGDARRERLIKSRSRSSWHLTSIPVPLPTPEREGVLSSSRLRAPAFRRIAPHSRALQRSQQLRQSQVGLQPSMRSKLRQTMMTKDTLHDQMEEARIDHELGLADDDEAEPVRHSKRGAAKAKLSPKASRMKMPKMEEHNAKPTTQASCVAEAAAPAPPTAPAKRDKFEVQPNDKPLEKQSVLRQGAAKMSRRHAPTGRITAFDDEDDEDDEEAMPNGEELAKIKLPQTMFPSDFRFDTAPSDAAPAPKPTSTPAPEASKKDTSLLDRLAPSTHTVTTTPMKEPAPGALRFDAKPAVEPAKPAPSSFFATAPTKTTVDTEKKSGPMPDFFGAAKATEAKSTGLGLAGAFSAAPKPASETKPASSFSFSQPTTETASEKKRDRDEDEPAAKRPASQLNAAAAPFLFGKPSLNADASSFTPSFSFGAPSSAGDKSDDTPATKKPAFSFGAPLAEKDKLTTSSEKDAPKAAPFSFGTTSSGLSKESEKPAPSFSFGPPATSDTSTAALKSQPPAFALGSTAAGEKKETPTLSFAPPKADEVAKDKPSFSFISSSEKEDKPTFSFGAPPAKKDENAKPALSFGSALEKKDKPAFSFGSASDKKAENTSAESTPALSFGQPTAKIDDKPTGGATTEAKAMPSFSFGAAEKKDEKPSFGFGTTEKKDDKPAFSFGQPTDKKDDKPAFSFGTSTDKKDDKPAFGFGAPAEKKDDRPAFSFGAASDKKDDKPAFAFGAAPSVEKASSPVTFGPPSSTSTSTPTEPAVTKPPSFSFGPPSTPSATPAFGSTSTTAPTTGFGFGKPETSTSSAPTFSFGASGASTAPAPAAPAATTSFSFGAPSTPAPNSIPAPTTTFSFGAPAPAPAPAPAAPVSTTSFSFGAPAAAPAPTTSFSFGSAAPTGVFQFGAGAPATSAPSSPAPTTTFSFGAPSAGAAAPGAATPFTFGAGNHSPAPGSPAPFTFGTPPPPTSNDSNPSGFFTMGTSPAPSGRQIKPLRQPRRRN